MYKLIVSDLDETLLQSDKNISTKDIEAINALNGLRFVISTGRGFESVTKTLKQLNQYDKEDTYTISFNGGIITENKDNKILYENPLSFNQASFLFELGKKYDVCIHVYTKQICYTYRIFDNEERYIKPTMRFINFDDHNLDFLKNKTIMKVLYCNEDMNYLRDIKQEIQLDNEYEISFSANRYIEFNPKAVNKGSGLIKLCEILNIDIKDTIAIGDSINDLSMLKVAGLSIGVSNCVDEVKPYCDHILDANHNSSPISELIEKYIKR